MAKILAIDSTMNGCSACVYEAGESGSAVLLAQEQKQMNRGQAEHLVPLIERVMKRAGSTYESLDLIGVTKGPGAFTGMRIGIATAKAIGLAAGKPVMGISTFDAVLDTALHEQRENNKIKKSDGYAVILETKRKDYYVQLFADINGKSERPQEITQGMTAGAEHIFAMIKDRQVVLIGDACERIISEKKIEFPCIEVKTPSPQSVARLAAFMYCSLGTGGEKDNHFKPAYLRGAEIGASQKRTRTLKKK
ncbi:MAG: tRNA (adenosine(37)-N6)-threonylcarbamoyltransferase complex dimerization subunit type 1 TsaB [Alphaproteobacteria bacterium]